MNPRLIISRSNALAHAAVVLDQPLGRRFVPLTNVTADAVARKHYGSVSTAYSQPVDVSHLAAFFTSVVILPSFHQVKQKD